MYMMYMHIIICEMWAFPCGRFHSAVAEAWATAYSKETSNESCREASKVLVILVLDSFRLSMLNGGSIQHSEPKRIGKQSLVRSLFCSVSENINQN